MRIIFISILIFNILSSNSQEIIRFQNSSFEGVPISGKTPEDWTNCSEGNHLSPSLHPDFTQPIFGIKKEAYDGQTYLGMVVRDDNTNDALGQKLKVSLQGEQCYIINMVLSKSLNYESVSPKTGEFIFYNNPVRIIIWGGYQNCHKQEILAQSAPIENLEWADFQFIFQPSKNFTHIVLEAYYVGNEGIAYNGNVLIDFISPIIIADCNSGKELAKPNNREKKPEKIVGKKRTPLANLEALEKLILEKTTKIQFQKDTSLFTNEGKSALLKIADAKLDFGRYRLGIYLKNNTTKKEIQELFSKNNIPTSSYRFLKMSLKEKLIAENEILEIGLIDRFMK